MQEGLKVTLRSRNSRDVPSDGRQTKEGRDSSDAPDLKVTLERPESLAAIEAGDVHERADSPAPRPLSGYETRVLHEAAEAAEGGSAQPSLFSRDMADATPAQALVESRDISDEDSESSDRDRAYTSRYSDTPSLRSPLLTAAAIGSLLIAGWSFTTLESTRAQLASVTAAKASVDQALADAQGRLAVTEKAMADVKAAIASIPLAGAAAKKASAADAAPVAAEPAAADKAAPAAASGEKQASPEAAPTKDVQ